ncbi:MAG: M48 family metallopeptidase [Magnetococcales bacterium]|nr:M48 family metallopeptidase [Magnetococcales bacterium]
MAPLDITPEMAQSNLGQPSITARYFDGQTSKEHRVQVTLFEDGGLLLIRPHQPALRYLPHEVEIGSRLGGAPRVIELSDGGQCLCDDNNAVDAALSMQSGGTVHESALIHTLESRWPMVAVAALLTIGFVWWLVVVGIPLSSEHISKVIPTSMNKELEEHTLALLEKSAKLGPSKLDQERVTVLKTLFDAMEKPSTPHVHYRLLVMDGGHIGANAMALPNGAIIVTDQMLRLVKHDDELRGILAHEAGHVDQRHGVRSVLQSSLALLVIAAVAGDVISITGFSGALPAALMEARYSQRFELEADDYAMRFMRRHQIPFHRFTDLLARLTSSQHTHGKVKQQKTARQQNKLDQETKLNAKRDTDKMVEETMNRMGQMMDFLSTHPATPSRVQRMLRLEKEITP